MHRVGFWPERDTSEGQKGMRFYVKCIFCFFEIFQIIKAVKKNKIAVN